MLLVDSYLYIISFIVVILIMILLIAFSQKQLIIIYRKQIAFMFAILQLIIFLWSSIFFIAVGRWYHLLLKDLCPTVAFLSIILFTLNDNKYLKPIMPWLIVGSVFTILGGQTEFLVVEFSLAFTSYSSHMLMLMQGIVAYIWVGKYTKKEQMQILIFPFLLVIWILIAGLIPYKITGDSSWGVFSTALLPPALTTTEVGYGLVGQSETITSFAFLGDFNMPYPLPTILFYFISLIFSYLIVLHKNHAHIYHSKIKETALKITQKISGNKLN